MRQDGFEQLDSDFPLTDLMFESLYVIEGKVRTTFPTLFVE